MRPAWERARLFVCAIAAVLPLAPWIFTLPAKRLGASVIEGDMAALGLQVYHAVHGASLLGPYSRFAWHHPGPAYFYWLAPFYAALRYDSMALVLGSLALNVACTVFTVWAALRINARALIGTTLVMAAFWGCFATVGLQPWNPAVIIVPSIALLLLAACPQDRVPPVYFAVIATFLVQTHIGVLVLVAGATAFRMFAHRDGRRVLRSKAVWAALTLMWLPPVIEECLPGGGNISRVIHFFLGDKRTELLSDAIALVANTQIRLVAAAFGKGAVNLPYDPTEVLSSMVLRASDQRAVMHAVVPFHLALFSAVALHARKRDPFVCRLAAIATGATLVAIFSATRAKGEPMPYLVSWALGPTMVGYIACITHAIYGVDWLAQRKSLRFEARAAVVAGIAVFALVLANMNRVARLRYEILIVNVQLDKAIGMVTTALRTRPPAAIELGSAWHIGTALALTLTKEGVPFATSNHNVMNRILLGRQVPLAPEGALSLIIHVSWPTAAEREGLCDTPFVEHGPFRFYLVRDPDRCTK